ncbi:MAG: hypothetical protein M1817_000825 [Caeruleum heppii]|nr:MAG: hypothetical protein M1817_000825 [Caeruleum heppii]
MSDQAAEFTSSPSDAHSQQHPPAPVDSEEIISDEDDETTVPSQRVILPARSVTNPAYLPPSSFPVPPFPTSSSPFVPSIAGMRSATPTSPYPGSPPGSRFGPPYTPNPGSTSHGSSTSGTMMSNPTLFSRSSEPRGSRDTPGPTPTPNLAAGVGSSAAGQGTSPETSTHSKAAHSTAVSSPALPHQTMGAVTPYQSMLARSPEFTAPTEEETPDSATDDGREPRLCEVLDEAAETGNGDSLQSEAEMIPEYQDSMAGSDELSEDMTGSEEITGSEGNIEHEEIVESDQMEEADDPSPHSPSTDKVPFAKPSTPVMPMAEEAQARIDHARQEAESVWKEEKKRLEAQHSLHVEQFKRRLNSLERRLGERKESEFGLDEERDRHQQEKELLEGSVQGLKEQVRQLRSEKSTLETNARAGDRELQRLQENLQQTAKKVAEKEEEAKRDQGMYRDAIIHLQTAATTHRRREAQTEQQLATMQRQVEEVRSHQASASDRHYEARAAELKAEVAESEAKLAENRNNCTTLEADVASKRATLHAMETLIEQYRVSIQKSEERSLAAELGDEDIHWTDSSKEEEDTVMEGTEEAQRASRRQSVDQIAVRKRRRAILDHGAGQDSPLDRRITFSRSATEADAATEPRVSMRSIGSQTSDAIEAVEEHVSEVTRSEAEIVARVQHEYTVAYDKAVAEMKAEMIKRYETKRGEETDLERALCERQEALRATLDADVQERVIAVQEASQEACLKGLVDSMTELQNWHQVEIGQFEQGLRYEGRLSSDEDGFQEKISELIEQFKAQYYEDEKARLGLVKKEKQELQEQRDEVEGMRLSLQKVLDDRQEQATCTTQEQGTASSTAEPEKLLGQSLGDLTDEEEVDIKTDKTSPHEASRPEPAGEGQRQTAGMRPVWDELTELSVPGAWAEEVADAGVDGEDGLDCQKTEAVPATAQLPPSAGPKWQQYVDSWNSANDAFKQHWIHRPLARVLLCLLVGILVYRINNVRLNLSWDIEEMPDVDGLNMLENPTKNLLIQSFEDLRAQIMRSCARFQISTIRGLAGNMAANRSEQARQSCGYYRGDGSYWDWVWGELPGWALLRAWDVTQWLDVQRGIYG